MAVRSGSVEFGLLGPLEISLDGSPVVVSGEKRRALLLLLLIHANEVISVDRLIDQLWGDRPPPTTKASLHNAVSRLRRLLGAELLETRGPGYALRIAPKRLDSVRFQLLRSQAESEAGEQRVQTLERALGLWRGRPLADVFYEEFAQSEIRRLEELRAATQEELCATRLDCGAVSEAVAELHALVALYPYREQLRHQLMLTLDRAGRSVDALRAYTRWQELLRDELNTQPSNALQQTAWAIAKRLQPRPNQRGLRAFASAPTVDLRT
jgi:DNA-binding SARP family transcriptional activator